jgi:hypothetical protein
VRDWPPKRTQKRQFWPLKKNEALRFDATAGGFSSDGRPATASNHNHEGDGTGFKAQIKPKGQKLAKGYQMSHATCLIASHPNRSAVCCMGAAPAADC